MFFLMFIFGFKESINFIALKENILLMHRLTS